MRANNQLITKVQNRNTVLKQIVRSGATSRVALSRYTGLTKMTITNIVNELLTDNLICEKDVFANSDVGRNPTLLAPKQDNHIIGLYISRDFVECFAGDISGKIHNNIKKQLSTGTVNMLVGKITDAIDEIIKLYPSSLGIGISCIGPVNSKDGIILNPSNFFGIKNLEIKKILEEKYNLPVFVDDDMKTSALAEKYWGDFSEKVSDYAYVGAARGIGAGIVTDGKLNDCICEIAHISIDVNGKKCFCGNRGCLERYTTIPHNFDGSSSDEICKFLSYGIITIMNMFNPQVIFLGHRIPLLGEDAPEKIKNYVKDKYLSRPYNDVEIRFSKFGSESMKYGAIANFIENYEF